MYHLMFNDSSSNELQQQVCLLASALHPRRLLPQIMGLPSECKLRRTPKQFHHTPRNGSAKTSWDFCGPRTSVAHSTMACLNW